MKFLKFSSDSAFLIACHSSVIAVYAVADLVDSLWREDGGVNADPSRSVGVQVDPLRVFEGHRSSTISAFAVVPDASGLVFVSGDSSGRVCLWEGGRNEMIGELKCKAGIECICIDNILPSRCLVSVEKGTLLELNLMKLASEYSKIRSTLSEELLTERFLGTHNVHTHLMFSVSSALLVAVDSYSLDLWSTENKLLHTSSPLNGETVAGVLTYIQYPTLKDVAIRAERDPARIDRDQVLVPNFRTLERVALPGDNLKVVAGLNCSRLQSRLQLERRGTSGKAALLVAAEIEHRAMEAECAALFEAQSSLEQVEKANEVGLSIIRDVCVKVGPREDAVSQDNRDTDNARQTRKTLTQTSERAQTRDEQLVACIQAVKLGAHEDQPCVISPRDAEVLTSLHSSYAHPLPHWSSSKRHKSVR